MTTATTGTVVGRLISVILFAMHGVTLHIELEAPLGKRFTVETRPCTCAKLILSGEEGSKSDCWMADPCR